MRTPCKQEGGAGWWKAEPWLQALSHLDQTGQIQEQQQDGADN